MSLPIMLLFFPAPVPVCCARAIPAWDCFKMSSASHSPSHGQRRWHGLMGSARASSAGRSKLPRPGPAVAGAGRTACAMPRTVGSAPQEARASILQKMACCAKFVRRARICPTANAKHSRTCKASKKWSFGEQPQDQSRTPKGDG